MGDVSIDVVNGPWTTYLECLFQYRIPALKGNVPRAVLAKVFT